MEPDHYRFGGGSSATVLHPLVAVAMVLAIFLILWAPLKNVLAPLLFAIFLIPKGQVLVLAGIHLNVYRIILLAGLVRWVISKRKAPLAGGFNSIDRLFAAGALSFFIIFSLQYMATQALISLLAIFWIRSPAILFYVF